jgi:hypothetical protein
MKRVRKERGATWELDISSSLTSEALTRWLDARLAGSVVFGMTAGLEQSNACVSDRRQREKDSRTEPSVEAASCSLDAMVRPNAY